MVPFCAGLAGMWPKLLYVEPTEFPLRRRTGVDLGCMFEILSEKLSDSLEQS